MVIDEKEFRKVDEEMVDDLVKVEQILNAYGPVSEYKQERILALSYVKLAILTLRNIPGKELP